MFYKVPGYECLPNFCSFFPLTDSTSFYLCKLYFGELKNSARARLLGTGSRSQIRINTNIFLSWLHTQFKMNYPIKLRGSCVLLPGICCQCLCLDCSPLNPFQLSKDCSVHCEDKLGCCCGDGRVFHDITISISWWEGSWQCFSPPPGMHVHRQQGQKLCWMEKDEGLCKASRFPSAAIQGFVASAAMSRTQLPSMQAADPPFSFSTPRQF